MSMSVQCRTPVPLLGSMLKTAQVGCYADRTSGSLDAELARRLFVYTDARAKWTSINVNEGTQSQVSRHERWSSQ